MKNVYHSEKLLSHGIRYVQKDKEGKIIGLWKSVADIAEHYGIAQSTIRNNVIGISEYLTITPRSKILKVE